MKKSLVLWLTLVLCVLSLSPILAIGAPTMSPLTLTAEQRHRLETGDVIVLDVLPPGAAKGSMGGTGIALVKASPEAVWHVLVDYSRHSGLYPRVVKAEIIESDSDRALVRYVVGVGPFSFGFHVNNYPDATHRHLDWRLEHDRPNDLFKESSGYWQIDPQSGHVILTYAMAARTVLPAFLTRGAERDGLVETLRAVRKRAEEN